MQPAKGSDARQPNVQSAVPGGPGHERVSSATAVENQEKGPLATRNGHQQNGPRRGPHVNSLCTVRGPEAPEEGKHVPEGTRTGVPAPASTGLAPKHTESGPVRPRYGPVRDPKCGHCLHPNPHHQGLPPNSPTPHRQGAALLGLNNLILLEKLNPCCNRVLSALGTNSRPRPHRALSLQALHHDVISPFMVRTADSRMTRPHPNM